MKLSYKSGELFDPYSAELGGQNQKNGKSFSPRKRFPTITALRSIKGAEGSGLIVLLTHR